MTALRRRQLHQTGLRAVDWRLGRQISRRPV